MSQEVIDIYKELSDQGIKENAYLDLEQNYNQLMNELGADSHLERYRDSIEQLYRTFQVSAANEKNLLKMFKELKKKFVDEQQKLNKLIVTRDEDKTLIESLTKRVNQLQKDNMAVRDEIRLKEITAKSEMSQLSSDKKKEELFADENIEALEKEKDTLLRQVDQYRFNLEKLDKDYSELLASKDKLENSLKDFKEELVTFKESNTKLIKDKEMLNKKIHEKEMEINKLSDVSEGVKKDFLELKNEKETLQTRNTKLESDILEKKAQYESMSLLKIQLEKTNKNIRGEILMYKEDLEKYRARDKENQSNIKVLEKDKDKLSQEINKRDIEIREKNRDIDKMNKEYEKVRNECTLLSNEIHIQKQEIEKLEKLFDVEKKQKEERMRENRNQEKEIVNKEHKLKSLEEKQVEIEGDVTRKKESLQKLKIQLEQAIKSNADLERSRDKVTEENTKLKNKIDHLLEDVNLNIIFRSGLEKTESKNCRKRIPKPRRRTKCKEKSTMR
jgi:chromosome segregation ATPase